MRHLEKIIDEIKAEINSRPQHANIGKKGCLYRIENLRDTVITEGFAMEFSRNAVVRLKESKAIVSIGKLLYIGEYVIKVRCSEIDKSHLLEEIEYLILKDNRYNEYKELDEKAYNASCRIMKDEFYMDEDFDRDLKDIAHTLKDLFEHDLKEQSEEQKQ